MSGSDEVLVDAFVGALGRPAPQGDRLASALRELVSRAQAAWPGLAIDEAHFVRYVAERLDPQTELLAALAVVHADDLFLACACASGDDAAIAALERAHGSAITGALAKIQPGRGGPTRDDVLQALRLRLFVGGSGQPPGIAAYSGRGRLSAWLHVTVMRAALNALRDAARPVDEELHHALAILAADPELEELRTSFREAFASTFGEAVASLSIRERALLRHALVDRLNVRQIARVYGVHFTTVARWIASARDRLAQETRRLLGARLDVSDTELHRMIGAMQSRIELSISRLFSPDEPITT